MIVHPVQMQRQNICLRCKMQIERGSSAIRVGIKQGAKWMRWNYYHPDCFPQQLTEYCQEWYAKHPYRCKLGRKKKDSPTIVGTRYGKPVQTTVQKEVRRLKALLRYHKRKGNVLELVELGRKILDLTRTGDCGTLSLVGSMTEHPATQGKGGCRSGDESDAQANSVRANCSAVQP